MSAVRRRRAIWALAAVLPLLAACATRPSGAGSFSFALMADQQYTARSAAGFSAMLEAISQENLAFVVHAGDFKAGSSAPCTDALYLQRRAEFERSRHALVYSPGDNEWVDCRRASNGGYEPLERLAKLRQVFFARALALGQEPMAVQRQSDVFAHDPVLGRYSENLLWVHAGVVFATFNIQGSNDNLGFDAAGDREHAERTRANIAWLKHALQRADRSDIAALAVFQQANPGFGHDPRAVARSGHAEYLRAFEEMAAALDKPVLFAHGDTHRYHVDRPYVSPLTGRALDHVTRVETWGHPFVNWVRVTVDPGNRHTPFFIESGDFSVAGPSLEDPRR